MIRRYVLWNGVTPSIASSGESSPAIREISSLSQTYKSNPETLPRISQLAVRRHLMETETGAEVVVTVIEGRPTLRVASRVTIAEIGLSVRSYNCLKSASIETLDELLSCTPAQLRALPNFGRKCFKEIADIVDQLGYPSFGHDEVDLDVQPNSPLQADSTQPAIEREVDEEGISTEDNLNAMDSQPSPRLTSK